MTNRIWVLGAPDPEMEAIEKLLTKAGERVAYATVAGRRAHPGYAYAAEVPFELGGGDIDAVYRVECAWPLTGSEEYIIETIDHHRPGDRGYGRPPADFLPASSIGQVIAELARLSRPHDDPLADYSPASDDDGQFVLSDSVGWTVSTWYGHACVLDEYVMTAAADHCLAAAYQGECPGVDPEALMAWRAESRATFQRRQVADVLADVERAREALRAAPELVLSWSQCDWHAGTNPACIRGDCMTADGQEYADDPCTFIVARDMRGRHVPELPEASAREGICFVADGLPDRDGRIKIVCQSGSPEQIKAFMQCWAPDNGLTDIYGDPARGFAGGYLP